MADSPQPTPLTPKSSRMRVLTPDERAQLAAAPVHSVRQPSPGRREAHSSPAASASAAHSAYKPAQHGAGATADSEAHGDFVVDAAELIHTTVTHGAAAKSRANGNGTEQHARRGHDIHTAGTRRPHPPGGSGAANGPRDAYGKGHNRAAHPTHARRRSPRRGGQRGDGHGEAHHGDDGPRSGGVKYTPREPGYKSLQPVLTLKQKRERERARVLAAADAASPQWRVAGFGSPQRKRGRGGRPQKLPLLYLQQHRSPRRGDATTRTRKHTSRSQERGKSGDRRAPNSARAHRRG